MRFSTMHHTNNAISQLPAYTEGMDILSDIGDEIRKTAHNLMPEVLLKQPLPDAIGNYCNYVQKSSQLMVDFQYFGTFQALSENFRLNLYRIIQELLKNIVQHAHAKHAYVQLLMNGNDLTVSVEDDGIGFDRDEAADGIGLHSLQTRVSSFDGTLS